MPRKPDPKSKHPQIIIKPRNIEEEKMIRGAKEIISRNPELTVISILKPFLKKHNWPPGNSQTQITRFGVKKKVTQKCEYPNCSNIAEYEDYSKPPGNPKVYSCQEHHKHALEKGLLKASKRL